MKTIENLNCNIQVIMNTSAKSKSSIEIKMKANCFEPNAWKNLMI